jgi:hypothetical protein
VSDIGVEIESGEKGGGEGLKDEAARNGADDMRIEETRIGSTGKDRTEG